MLAKLQELKEKKVEKDKKKKEREEKKREQVEKKLEKEREKEEKKREKEEQKRQKELEKREKKQRKIKTKRKAESSDDDEYDNEKKWQVKRDSGEEDSDEDDVESEEESEVESEDENAGFSGRLSVSSMETFWKEVNPPNTENQITGKWVACIFSGRVANLFIGKILRRYLSDSVEEGGFAVALEVDCLQQKYGISDNFLKEHDKTRKDIGNVPVKDIIFGPLRGIYRENGKWEFPQYPNVKTFFENIKKENREAMYNKFISNLFQEKK